MTPEPRNCHVDGQPCHNEPLPDHQQECRYWWNVSVLRRCAELVKEAKGAKDEN
jgi:hypothetical protein